MRKKILVVMVLAVCCIFALTACTPAAPTPSAEAPASEQPSQQTAEEAPAPAADGAPVSIEIFQFKVEIVDALNAAIEQYKSVAPNVSITLETVGGGDDIGPALKAKFASGKGPTIYNIGGPSDIELYDGKLVDLTNEAWVANAIPGTLDNASKDGKVYGLPYATEGFGLVYNKEIFEAAGVDLGTLNTFDGIQAAFKTVNDKIADGTLKEKYPDLEAAVELAAKETWILGDHASNLPLGKVFEYDTFKAYGFKTVDFGATSAAYKDYIDLQVAATKNAKDPSKLLAVDYSTEVNGGIALERVACIQQGNWIYGDVKSIDEAVAEKLDFMPAPLKGIAEDSIYVLVPMYWCVNSQADEAQIQAAKDFLNWLYQSEEGKQIVVQNFGFIPPFTNYGDMKPADPLAQSILKYADEGKTLGCVFKGYPDGWSGPVLGANIQGYIGGTQSWDDAIKKASDEWAKLRG